MILILAEDIIFVTKLMKTLPQANSYCVVMNKTTGMKKRFLLCHYKVLKSTVITRYYSKELGIYKFLIFGVLSSVLYF